MLEQMLFIVIGAVLALGGGFIQSWYNNRKERKSYLLQKREEAYLKYIDALYELREDNMDGSVKFHNYSPKYRNVKPEIALFASKKVIERIKVYESWLEECWEVNFNVNDVITEANNIISFIRDELSIK